MKSLKIQMLPFKSKGLGEWFEFILQNTFKQKTLNRLHHSLIATDPITPGIKCLLEKGHLEQC